MNNPYKYVDRGGNKSIKISVNPVDFLKKQTEKESKKFVNNVLKVTNNIASLLNKDKEKEKHNDEISNSNGINNNSSKMQDETRKRLEKMNKALEAIKAEPCPDIDLRKTQWNTFFGTYQKVKNREFTISVYEHKEISKQKFELVGSVKNSNYEAIWIGRQAYISAFAIIDFIKTLKTFGADEVTIMTVKEVAKNYGLDALSNAGTEVLYDIVECLTDNSTRFEDMLMNTLKYKLGFENVYIYLWK